VDYLGLDGWISLVGVGFGLGDLDVIGIIARASILTTSRVAVLEATSSVLTVSTGLGVDICSRISFWFIFGNLANTELTTNLSKMIGS